MIGEANNAGIDGKQFDSPAKKNVDVSQGESGAGAARREGYRDYGGPPGVDLESQGGRRKDHGH